MNIYELEKEAKKLARIAFMPPVEAIKNLLSKEQGKCISCGYWTDQKHQFSEGVDEEGNPEPGPTEWCHDECLERIRDFVY